MPPKTTPKRQPRALWTTIREAYVASDTVSCQTLSELFNVRQWTISARCKREGWQALREQRLERGLPLLDTCPPGAQIAQVEAPECTKALTPIVPVPSQIVDLKRLDPREFNERLQQDAVRWLDRIEELRLSGVNLGYDPIEVVRVLVPQWRTAAEMGRKALGLDQQPEGKSMTVNVGILGTLGQLGAGTPIVSASIVEEPAA